MTLRGKDASRGKIGGRLPVSLFSARSVVASRMFARENRETGGLAPIFLPCDTICRMPRSSLADYIEDFRRYGRDIAFVDRKGYRSIRWTYPRVAETAAQVARELDRLGVQKGERAVLWGDCAEWIAAFYGCVL